MKTCSKCGAIKPKEDFYQHRGMSDGVLGKCKECTKADVRANRMRRIEYYREYDRQRGYRPDRQLANRERQKTDAGKAVHAAASRRYYERYPDKSAAHTAVSNAIRDGRMLRLPCEVCGVLEVESHHEDYSKPLEVRWLCVPHHKARHRELNALARQRMKEAA